MASKYPNNANSITDMPQDWYSKYSEANKTLSLVKPTNNRQCKQRLASTSGTVGKPCMCQYCAIVSICTYVHTHTRTCTTAPQAPTKNVKCEMCRCCLSYRLTYEVPSTYMYTHRGRSGFTKTRGVKVERLKRYQTSVAIHFCMKSEKSYLIPFCVDTLSNTR